MAIVKEFKITEGRAKGCTVRIDDSCYRGISPEELERRRMEVTLAIRRIDRNMQMREYEERMAKEQQER